MKNFRSNHGKFFGCALLICFLFSVSLFAQTKKSDLQSRGLKARVKTVKEYSVFYTPDGKIFKKYFRGWQIFDAKGRLTESLQTVDQGENSFYERYKFGFDKRGRRILEEVYTSSKTDLKNVFLPNLAETDLPQLNPNLTEKLSLKTTRKYNAKGDVTEETFIDAASDEILKTVYVYKAGGDFEIYTSKNDGTPELEAVAVYKDRNTRFETTFFQNSKPEHKTIFYYDGRKRLLYREQFGFKSGTNNDGFTEILAFRTNETKRGAKRETEHLSFDETGFAVTKSVHFFENELQKAQIVYKRENVQKSDWSVFYQTKTEYEFDQAGSWTNRTLFKQEGANPQFVKTYAVERVISYY